jgi:hypothetical protein
MTNAAKAKGSRAERLVVTFLQAAGWKYAERRLAGATLDRGDIAGVNGICFEVKNQKRLDLAGWVDELEVETVNSKSDLGFVVFPRPRKGDPKDWYFLMPGHMAVKLLEKAGY